MGSCFSTNNKLNNNQKIQTTGNKKTENITGHLAIPERIIKLLYNSIVNLRFKNSENKYIFATGFFLLIKLKYKLSKFLFTCKHVISEEDIDNKIIINLYNGEKNKENKIDIKLDKSMRIIKTFETDVTIIEIIEDDKIPDELFLIPDLNYEYGYKIYLDKYFYMAGYPGESNDRCVSSGQITKIDDKDEKNEFVHTLSTTPGSSGSPICNEIGEVIGIHKEGDIINKKINYGSFIGKIIEALKIEEEEDLLEIKSLH